MGHGGTLLDSCDFSVGRMKWAFVEKWTCHCWGIQGEGEGKAEKETLLSGPRVLPGLPTQVRGMIGGLGEETESPRSVILECGMQPAQKAASDLFLVLYVSHCQHSVSETARLPMLFIFLISTFKILELGPGEIARLVKCLPCKHTDLSSHLRVYINKKLGTVMHAGNPSAWEMETIGWFPEAHWPAA